jgi:hypothetical protein
MPHSLTDLLTARRVSHASIVGLGLAASLLACSDESPPSTPPSGETVLAPPEADSLAGTGTATSTDPILYHGGPVMGGTSHVYVIWYGSWAPAAVSVVEGFVGAVGPSPYFAINAGYKDSKGAHPEGATLAGSTTDAYSRGKAVAQADIVAIVSTAITAKKLPLDANGVYFVLTSADVTQTGFCTKFCGWHTYVPIGGVNVKYSFIGDASKQCPQSCGVRTPSPNAQPGADALINVLAHELDESVTDPQLNAFYDAAGNENGDKCAWTFGTTHTTASGALANVKLGAHDYLVQQNWVNATNGGHCGLAPDPVGSGGAGGASGAGGAKAGAGGAKAGAGGAKAGAGGATAGAGGAKAGAGGATAGAGGAKAGAGGATAGAGGAKAGAGGTK